MKARRLSRNWIRRTARRVRFNYLRLLLGPDTPKRMATGLALGVFVGCLPIIPFQTAAAIGLALLFKSSVIAAAAGTWITNPFTTAPLYAAFFYIGRLITPLGQGAGLPENITLQSLVAVGFKAAGAALIGGVVFGLVLAPVTYYIGLNYLGKLQTWERKKLRDRFGIPTPDIK